MNEPQDGKEVRGLDFDMNMVRIENLCCREVQEHMTENQESWKRAGYYLEHSTAKYHGNTVYSLYIPKIFTQKDVAHIKWISETMAGIMVKAMKEYMKNPEYRKLFGFDKSYEELMLIDPGYRDILPVCRVDIFLDERNGSFKFCELNTDGTSAMNDDRELNNAAGLLTLVRSIRKEYDLEPFELFDTLTERFLENYKTYLYRVERPTVAIVDFPELGCSLFEFEEFRKSFERHGIKAIVADIRKLRFDGEKLTAHDGTKIDLIYRRAVTSDIMKYKDEAADFINAVKSHKVCVMGNFITQTVHDKRFFIVLRDEATKRILTDDENRFIEEHVPYTAGLTDDSAEELDLYNNKDRWLLKPSNGYGARGIYAGIDHNEKNWAELIDRYKGNGYIVQEFIKPYQSKNIDFEMKDREIKFRDYSNLTGLYVYCGKFAGVYARQSEVNIISDQYDENDVAAMQLLPKKV